MTQFIEPNKKSDLTGPNALTWLQSLRTGLLEGFTVTKGSATWLINIASGKLVLKGTNVYDDETRTDDTVLQAAFTPGQNSHAIVYAQYTYADTFPPANMTLGVAIQTAASPGIPAIPAQPADSVKLADIFIPSTATAITDADVKIVNAPKIPALGTDDADVLLERVVSSNYNLVVTGGGAFTYNPGTDVLSWTEDLYLYAQAVTIQERYMSAPLAVGRIVSGSLSNMGDNAVAFVVFDRSAITAVGSPVVLTPKVLDLDDASTSDIADFFNAGTREQIVWLAMTVGGVLKRRAGFGNIFADEVVYDPSASGLTATDVQAAIDEVEGRVDTAETNITTNTTDIGELRTVAERGLGFISGFSPTGLGSATLNVGSGSGVDNEGRYFSYGGGSFSAPTYGVGKFVFYWSPDSETVEVEYLSTGVLWGALPICVAESLAGTVWDNIEQCQMRGTGEVVKSRVTVGGGVLGPDGTHFSTLHQALIWMSCFKGSTVNGPRRIDITSSTNETHVAAAGGCISVSDWSLQYLNRLTGLHVVGLPQRQSEDKATIGFGSGAESLLFDFGHQLSNVRFENLRFVYNGLVNNANHDICVFKNPGKGFFVDNCEIGDGAAKLTHFAVWRNDGANVELGGLDINEDSRGTVFRGLNLDQAVDNTNALFYLDVTTSGAIDGHLTLEECTFVGWGATGPGGVVYAADQNTCTSFSVTAHNMHIAGCEGVVFDVLADGQIQCSDTKFWYSHSTTGAYADVANCLNAVFTNCLYKNTQNITLNGALYSNCRSLDGNVAPSGVASMVNCDFPAVVWPRLIDPAKVQDLVALDIAGIGEWTGMEKDGSYILYGLVVSYDWITTRLSVERGVGYCNGKIVYATGSTIDHTAASSWVDGTIPGTNGWAYAFVRSDGTKCLSEFPPTNGHLNASETKAGTHVGYDDKDYIFMGSAYYLTAGPGFRAFARRGDRVYHAPISVYTDTLLTAHTGSLLTDASTTLPVTWFPGSGFVTPAVAMIANIRHMVDTWGAATNSSIIVRHGKSPQGFEAFNDVMWKAAAGGRDERNYNQLELTLHRSGNDLDMTWQMGAVTGATTREVEIISAGYIEPLNRLTGNPSIWG